MIFSRTLHIGHQAQPGVGRTEAQVQIFRLSDGAKVFDRIRCHKHQITGLRLDFDVTGI
ncbi:MAG: hypothetical protein LRZ88_03675 [Candidatus Cloacimonetes bacterium]|nr:hypothetical protein [Candidatus Cloacimonadota bacterium]